MGQEFNNNNNNNFLTTVDVDDSCRNKMVLMICVKAALADA